MSPARQNPILISIQLLRAVAALLVVGHHIFNLLHKRDLIPFSAEGARWIDAGIFGVHLFFVISGFIIYLSVYRSGQPQPVRRFIKARIVRIVPLYWLIITLLFAILLFAPSFFNSPREELVKNYFYSLAFFGSWRSAGDFAPLLTPGWTLDFEMLFYLSFAFYLWLRTRMAAALSCGILLVFIALLYAGLIAASPVFYANSPIVLEFAMGLWLARYFYPRRHLRVFVRYGWLLLPLGIAWFLLSWGSAMVEDRLVSWGISAALIVAGAVCAEPWIARKKWLCALSEIGNWSYSVYLLYTFVVYGFYKMLNMVGLWNPALYIGGVFALSLLAGCISYYGFERPVNRFFGHKV